MTSSEHSGAVHSEDTHGGDIDDHDVDGHGADHHDVGTTAAAATSTPDAAEDDEQSRSVEEAIAQALAGLAETPELPVAEHVERFETVHSVLADALNRAESLLSGSSGSGG